MGRRQEESTRANMFSVNRQSTSIESNEEVEKTSEDIVVNTSTDLEVSTGFDNLFTMGTEGHGVPKTIYFKSDVFAFCDSYCKRYKIHMSEVVNTLLRQVMKSK